MRTRRLIASAALLATGNAEPAIVDRPALKVGDSWVFEDTHQRGTAIFNQNRVDLVIERTGGDTMMVGIKPDGAPMAYEDHVVGPDWSQRHIVDGQEMPTTRPFNFPMRLGQSWTIDFTDSTRRGAQVSLHVHRTYKVVSWEDVTVPAGTFHAMKIEATGTSDSVVVVPTSVVGGAASSPSGSASFTRSQHGGTRSRTARLFDQLYYVPEVNNLVKSVEEQYNTLDVLAGRDTRVLVSYHVAG